MGSMLAVVKSYRVQKAISANLRGDTWIGLYRDPKYTSRWLWIDRSRPYFTYWHQGEPNNHKGTFEGCGMMWSWSNRLGRWNDAPCSIRHRYVCQRPVQSNG